MKNKPYILQYQEAIRNGYIDIDGERKPLYVGWKIKQVVDILAGYLNDDRIIFDPAYAYKRIKFQEKACLQGNAPYYNVPMNLMLWQKVIWEAVYGFYEKETGTLLINELFLEVARKNGKSTMIAGDANTDLFIGQGGVNLCCCSNDDRQAKFIWKECAGMQSRLDTKQEITTHNLMEIKNLVKNITIMRLSSKTQSKDGFNFVKAYQDEAHDCKDDEIAEAVQRAMSTHDERLFTTVSTQGFLIGMYYDKKIDYANKWINGEIDNIHYLPFLFEQDDEAECWGDIELLQKSNPSLIYGVKKYRFLEESRQKALIDKESRMHFLTKDCNVKVSNAKAWLMLEEYDYPQEPWTLKDFKGCPYIGGVDLSDCGDLTVGVALFMKKDSDVKYILTQFFIPESKLKDKDNGARYDEWSKLINPVTGQPYIIVCNGYKIDQQFVAKWFLSLRAKYDMYGVSIGYDRWHSDVFLLWCDRKTGYDLQTERINQNPNVMSFPMKTLERDIQAKLVNYGNNPVLKYCFSNTTAVIKNDKIMADKIDGQYARKIDGVVATIIAYATLEKNEAEFKQHLR